MKMLNTYDTPERRFGEALDKLTTLISKGHWSSAETTARVKDARASGRFEAYREICTLLVTDCEVEQCNGHCIHERMLEQFHESMTSMIEGSAVNEPRSAHAVAR